ncbi:MAG: NADH-quinone oxidoreductase subunit NuoH, partial [Sorangiineae bacterium]|nr:NADH-quinone oxidoreductase subunit NuoH [Sorangiineae bacterium]
MRAAPWLVLLVALSVVLGACGGNDAAPQLVQVTDVSPRDVALGDQLELSGAGFPAGKPATVEFHGDRHRPGQSPQRGGRIGAKGASRAARRV